jgi:vesicle coat complex subunit
VAALARALEDDDALLVRQIAAWALGRIGTAAREAVPALASALEHPDPIVRRNAAWALASIGTAASTAIPGLERALADPDPAVREEAREALAKVTGTWRPEEQDGGKGGKSP